MLTNIFDSHAHYDDARFAEDLHTLLAQFPSHGVCGVLSCGVNVETSRFALALAHQYNYMYAAAGFHPLNLEDVPADFEAVLKDLLADEKAVAVGEIGLDYYYEKETREQQLDLFTRQLRVAKECDLPVVVHDREAHEDVLRLLQAFRPRGVVHCFSGSVEMAKEVLKLGMYIGLGGAVTFKNAVKPVAVAKMVPADRLLVETDAPYMTPVPDRGKRCDSEHIRYTAQRLAEIRGTTAQAILDTTAQNAATLFGVSLFGGSCGDF